MFECLYCHVLYNVLFCIVRLCLKINTEKKQQKQWKKSSQSGNRTSTINFLTVYWPTNCKLTFLTVTISKLTKKIKNATHASIEVLHAHAHAHALHKHAWNVTRLLRTIVNVFWPWNPFFDPKMSLKHAATHFVQHFMAKHIFKRKNYARDFF